MKYRAGHKLSTTKINLHRVAMMFRTMYGGEMKIDQNNVIREATTIKKSERKRLDRLYRSQIIILYITKLIILSAILYARKVVIVRLYRFSLQPLVTMCDEILRLYYVHETQQLRLLPELCPSPYRYRRLM